mgnify:CR=1 FL=1
MSNEPGVETEARYERLEERIALGMLCLILTALRWLMQIDSDIRCYLKSGHLYTTNRGRLYDHCVHCDRLEHNQQNRFA